MFFYFISSADLISIHSILFYSALFQIDSIWSPFDLIEFDLLYCSVLYLISMNDLCLSVRLSVYLFICMNKFMFSLLSCFFILSLLFLFSFHFHFSFFTLFIFISLSFLMNVFLTHTRTRTHKYIWIYFPSYDSYILLQKDVSEESYSSDSIIPYLI